MSCRKNEERKKALERAEKEYAETKNAAMRIVDFITKDESMKKMTPGHIKDVLNMAHSIISKAAGCITLGQLCDICTQLTKDSVPEQSACQEPRPTS